MTNQKSLCLLAKSLHSNFQADQVFMSLSLPKAGVPSPPWWSERGMARKRL